MLSTSYELSLAKSYVSHWGMIEAVRELLQNALDSESAFEWEFKDDALFLHSRNSLLEPRTLLLGITSKADNKDAIGSFGEGYKIAMLVLTRLGYGLKIYNGRNTWIPEFRFNRKYDSDMLYVVSTNSKFVNEGTTFKISGLSEYDIEYIKDSCLHMQKDIGEIKQTRYGKILINKPGRLYVGGLFICTTELKFGYDILPQYIRLERDRQTVDNWDLKVITRDMWFDTEDLKYVAKLIEAGVEDLDHASWSTTNLVKEACYQHFIREHKGAIIAENQRELDALVKKGMTNVVIVRSTFGNIVKSHSSYSYEVSKILAPPPITTELRKWLKENSKYMRKPARESFFALINKAKNWRHL